MELDIDAILGATLPWDFTVRVGGVSYATRRPAVGELAAFATLAAQPERLHPLVSALFEAGDPERPPPDTAAWSPEQLTAFVSGYTEYFTRVAAQGKDPAAAGAAARATVAAALRPADPTGV